jgi:uracil-DNA glycosylase
MRAAGQQAHARGTGALPSAPRAEWALLSRVSVVVCLGRIAYDICWQILEARGMRLPKPRPAFAHGQVVSIPGGPSMIAAYHPSRQNTNTGRLTPEMLASVFRAATSLIR